MKSLREVEQEIIAEFAAQPDVDAKYVHLFEIGQQVPPLPAEHKTDANRVQGCQSALWFNLYENEDGLHLQAESDSMVINSIAALLARLVEGRRPEDIEALSLDFLDALQIWKLASTRNNGLLAMLAHIKQQAAALAKKDH